ncbi:M64 family metallopeptidase [Aliikangiella coralliicola]|uniref:Peptidase M64 N-terminal domain-containing protein n=1 Tax=Aliikangiella coralliicola TaxID=2592383 RepID=A0A545U8W1_9GAMM|nr:M64 family metallopeptidase [Aliikangiella coralliicola]TQV85910.1 hypothetical protein FLL46_18480 [Aliikangiella coralliicola]
MKLSTLVFLLLIYCPGTNAIGFAEGTLRMDYLHTGGNRTSDSIKFVELIDEAQKWSGLLESSDKLLRGDYQFTITDQSTRQVLFTNSFSSVYSDWAMSVEYKEKQRTFEESIRFPKPSDDFTVTLFKRDLSVKGQPFVKFWEKSFVLKKEKIRALRKLNIKSEMIIESGSPEKKVDVVIIAEGFTKADETNFFEQAKQVTRKLFSYSPYKEYQSHFNVRAIFPVSEQRGVAIPSKEYYPSTALSVYSEALGMTRYALTLQNNQLRDIAANVPYDTIIILTNSNKYSAAGIYGAYTIVPAFEQRSGFLMAHEFGHHFAGLADEYFHSTPGYEKSKAIIEPYQPNITIGKTRKTIKWRDLIGDKTPIPTPWQEQDDSNLQNYSSTVGAFEGAFYSKYNYFRPSESCLMRLNGKNIEFCTVCKEAIIQMIKAYSK